VEVILQKGEMDELMRQNPKTKSDGGFQSLMVRLQRNIDRQSGKLPLSVTDLEQIPRYAFSYKNGGWQNRLLAIFSRTLGPKLDGSMR